MTRENKPFLLYSIGASVMVIAMSATKIVASTVTAKITLNHPVVKKVNKRLIRNVICCKYV